MTSTVNRSSEKQSKPTAEEIIKQAQAQVKEEQKTAQEPLETCESEPPKKQEKPKPTLKVRDKTKAQTGEAIQQYKETSKQAYTASFQTGKQEGEAIANIERQGSHLGYIQTKVQHLIEDTVARRNSLPQFREMVEIELAEAEEFNSILEGDKQNENPLEKLLKGQMNSENSSNSFSLFLEG
ncbi:MAG: hypothetical protein KA714_30485 [Limnoraphis sp. WC205]|jgi:hypothetical protein|nr:hypothetical protein [Limnoraphis sp. WC205]